MRSGQRFSASLSVPEFSPASSRLGTPIRIGVIADTHVRRAGAWLSPSVIAAFSGCDCIFHAGDICVPDVLSDLEQIAPVFAVCGNNDPASLRAQLPRERVFEVGSYRIGLTHGDCRLLPAREWALRRWRGEVACVVYGHSHVAEVVECFDVLMVNPGSPTRPNFGRTPSVAIIDVRDAIRARIVEVG